MTNNTEPTNQIPKNYSLSFEVHTDHAKRMTVLTLKEYGEEKGSIRYDEKIHYALLVKIIEAFKGEGCCDQTPNKPDVKTHPKEYDEWLKRERKNPKYYNRPLHDVYASRE